MKIFTILLFALATAGCLLATDRAKNTIILDDKGVRNLRIEVVEADYTNFEETVFAIGRIAEIPANRAVLSTRVAGRVLELKAHEGDWVEKGQSIAVIESLQAGDPPPKATLHAPMSGLIVASHIRLGQPVTPAEELMHIADRSTVWAVAQIPEQEAAKVKEGTLSYIRIPALGEAIIQSKVLRFGVKADPQVSTVETIFEIPNASGRLKPGMRADFSIVLEKRSHVLAVPREAIQGDPAQRIVFVKDFELPHAFVRAPVVLGKSNEQYVEILEGVFPGDEVVTRGSYGLSFAGGGTGISLKEALDAAHGHSHNEDGSEITGEKNPDHKHEGHSHDESEDGHHHPEYIVYLGSYAVIVTLILLIMIQQTWNKKRNLMRKKEAAPHA